MKTGLGQDSHRFETENQDGKVLILGGIEFPGEPALSGNSDADVVLHAITNAISSITGINILGEIADKMCKEQGIKDSSLYLREALKYLRSWEITHVAISLECKRPKITPKIPEMRQKIAQLLGIMPGDVGITATTGEGLTDFGRGLGIQALVILSVVKAGSRNMDGA